jgi:hypothetical protein
LGPKLPPRGWGRGARNGGGFPLAQAARILLIAKRLSEETEGNRPPHLCSFRFPFHPRLHSHWKPNPKRDNCSTHFPKKGTVCLAWARGLLPQNHYEGRKDSSVVKSTGYSSRGPQALSEDVGPLWSWDLRSWLVRHLSLPSWCSSCGVCWRCVCRAGEWWCVCGGGEWLLNYFYKNLFIYFYVCEYTVAIQSCTDGCEPSCGCWELNFRTSARSKSTPLAPVRPAGSVPAFSGPKIYLLLYIIIHQKWASDLITDGCEPPCGGWDLNSGPSEEQSVLLPAEPSRQPAPRTFLRTYQKCSARGGTQELGSQMT